MSPLAPSQVRKQLELRRRAAAVSTSSSPPRRSFFERLVPPSVLNTFNYARSNPGSVAAHGIPFGLGAVFGVSREARLDNANRTLMKRIAANSVRTRNSFAQQQQGFSAAVQAGQPYSPPYRQPRQDSASTPPSPRSFPASRRQPPPVAGFSRPVARKTSDNLRSSFATSLAAWVQQRARGAQLRASQRRA